MYIYIYIYMRCDSWQARSCRDWTIELVRNFLQELVGEWGQHFIAQLSQWKITKQVIVIMESTWVCLKIGYIPNEIAI